VPLLHDQAAFDRHWLEYQRLLTPRAERLIVEFRDLHREDVGIAGGKGANLGEMFNRGEPVPPGVVISAAAYRAMLDANPSVRDAILTILQDTDAADSAQTERASQQIEALILNVPPSEDLERLLRASYRHLSEQLDYPNHDLKVAMRSSSTKEDLATAAYAGQLESYLNIEGEEAVLETLPRNWASLYTKRVIEFRDVQILAEFAQEVNRVALRALIADLQQEPPFLDLAKFLGDVREDRKTKTSPRSSYVRLRSWLRQRTDRYQAVLDTLEEVANDFLDPRRVEIAVVMQQQVESQRSLVLFSVDPATGFTARNFGRNSRIITLAVNYGIGESIVQGLVTPDVFRILAQDSPQTGSDGRRHYTIMRRTLGPKTIQTRYLERLLAEVSLTEPQLRILAEAVKALRPVIDRVLRQDAQLRQSGEPGLDVRAEVRRRAVLERTIPRTVETGYRTQVQPKIAAPSLTLAELAYELVRMAEVRAVEHLPDETELQARGLRLGLQELAVISRILKAFNEHRRTAETLIFDERLRHQFAATEEEVLEIARIADRSIEAYGNVRDMEGALD
jgi:hypothetical protein